MPVANPFPSVGLGAQATLPGKLFAHTVAALGLSSARLSRVASCLRPRRAVEAGRVAAASVFEQLGIHLVSSAAIRTEMRRVGW